MFLTTRVIIIHHFPYLGPADKGARAPTRGTSWAESGILFDEPDVLHSSVPGNVLANPVHHDNLWLLTCGTDYSLSLILHLYLTLALTLTLTLVGYVHEG